MKVSVVLPTYNEAANIVELVEELERVVPDGWDPEIIVVDDDSPDGTYRMVLDRFIADDRVMPILRQTDRGLAKSIRAGIEKASGDVIIAMGADFTHSPNEIPKMLHVIGAYDIVVGSRFCAGGRMHSTMHYIASLYYNRMIRVILRTQVQDNLGGYFAMRADQLRALPFDKIFFGYGDFFFRLLHYAQRRDMSIVEVPTTYEARREGRSKSNFAKLLVSYTWAVLRLRVTSFREPDRER
jgi:dolichol-phosphate mannosyltransferase